MGNCINAITRPIFYFPIKLDPICFLRQEEYNSTGELIPEVPKIQEQQLEYEKVLQTFAENLKAKKKKQGVSTEDHQENIIRETLESFPRWTSMTISILHHLYLLFADPKNSMLSFHDFCAILQYLGDKSNESTRAINFDEADKDKDGFILYTEFLPALYNFKSSQKNHPHEVADLCEEAAERTRSISTLTLGEQLEYGLF